MKRNVLFSFISIIAVLISLLIVSHASAQNEGEGGGVEEGNDETDELVENLVRIGYEDRAKNRIAINAADGDMNAAIQYLKTMKAERTKKVVFVEVEDDDEDMPPPPKYNPKARKASNAQVREANNATFN